MQRLIEQLVAEGAVFNGDTFLGRVQYHLAVYQHFSGREGEQVPSHVVVEGRVTALDDLEMARLHRIGQELTLRLADGRTLDFRVTHADGTIHSTARGLHEPG